MDHQDVPVSSESDGSTPEVTFETVENSEGQITEIANVKYQFDNAVADLRNEFDAKLNNFFNMVDQRIAAALIPSYPTVAFGRNDVNQNAGIEGKNIDNKLAELVKCCVRPSRICRIALQNFAQSSYV